MIQNNLDKNVAEDPDNLIVYGGLGKAARDWKSYDKILKALIDLENDGIAEILAVDLEGNIYAFDHNLYLKKYHENLIHLSPMLYLVSGRYHLN